MSLVLLSGAGLFFRSFLKSYADSGGIDVERMVTMRLWLPDATYPDPDAVARRIDDIVAGVQALPGVTNVTASSLIPLDHGTRGATLLPERGPSAPGEELRLRYAAVTADFFPTIGVPVQRGRDFMAFEGTTRSGVAVVNAAMAARLWPSEDPLGRQFRFADAAGSEPFRVIGVVPNFNNEGVVDERAPVPTAYIPFAYDPARDAGLMVRTAGDPAAMTPAIREAIRALDANLPLNEVRSMAQLQRDESWAFNFTAWTFGLLGGVALILGGMGVFGVLAYAVSQRTYEIGVRMALGARGVDIVAMFMRHGAWLCGLGVLVGLGLTLAVARCCRSRCIRPARATRSRSRSSRCSSWRRGYWRVTCPRDARSVCIQRASARTSIDGRLGNANRPASPGRCDRENGLRSYPAAAPACSS